jgi:hypothetical protein
MPHGPGLPPRSGAPAVIITAANRIAAILQAALLTIPTFVISHLLSNLNPFTWGHLPAIPSPVR